MKWSINAWAFDPSMGWRERARVARDAGFEAIEVNVGEDEGDIPAGASASELAELKRTLRNEGLGVSSVCSELFWRFSLTSAHAAERAHARHLARRSLEIGAELEAASAVVIPGVAARRDGSGLGDRPADDTTWRESVKELRDLALEATRLGIVIGVENVHFNDFLVNPVEMRRYLHEVDRASVRAHLDIGNANVAGPAEAWIDCLSSLVVAIHVKDSRRGAPAPVAALPPGSGDVCWPSVARSLERCRFRGYAIVEQSFRSTTWDRSIRNLGRASMACLLG